MPGLDQMVSDAVALVIVLPALGFLGGLLVGLAIGRR